MNAKKVELISQLLAKAESTTPEEAEALTEHAERLMLKYMVDQAAIDAHRGISTEEPIVEERMDFTGVYRGELLHLGISVIRGLGGLSAMQYTGGKGKVFSLWIIGYRNDVDQAKLLIESLKIQSMVAVRSWWKKNKDAYSIESTYDQEKARRSYVRGFGTGAGVRILDSRNTIVEEAGDSTALVLVSRENRVKEYVAAKATRKSRARTATAGNAANWSGFIDGQNANTGEKQVSQ